MAKCWREICPHEAKLYSHFCSVECGNIWAEQRLDMIVIVDGEWKATVDEKLYSPYKEKWSDTHEQKHSS